MKQTLEATFDGEVFRPLQTVELRPDTRVQLIVLVRTEAGPEPVSFLDVAESMQLPGPEDWSTRLDEYLYGQDQVSP